MVIDNKTSKKILFYIPSLEGGGAEEIIAQLANSLYEKKFNLTLLIGGKDEKSPYKISENMI